MKPEQFSHRIGNIEDRLVEQSKKTPNFGRQHRTRNIRRMTSVAAIVALMVCSFAIGAFAAQKEPETIVIGDSGISLILPDEWSGKYGYDIDGNNIAVYHLTTHEDKDSDWYGQGYLFWIACVEGQLPMDYVYPEPGYTIATTATHTYRLIMASDVQYDPANDAAAKEYIFLSNNISKIQILLTDWMTQNSTNASNWAPGTAYVYFIADGEVTDTIICDGTASQRLNEIIESQDYSTEIGSVPMDMEISINDELYQMNSTTGHIRNAAEYPYGAVLSAENLQEIMTLLND